MADMPSALRLEAMKNARFLVSRAEASVGVGERRSRTKGAGLEFAEHRAYRQGDDTRHLDARVLARLNEYVIRLYSVDRQLPVVIILDGSGSMRYGTPDKFAFAATLAQLLGFIGLSSGEQVQLGLAASGRLRWSPRLRGANRADAMLDWVRRCEAGGRTSFGAVLNRARADLPRNALVILISDWWGDDLDRPLDALAADGHEIVALHVVAPEESNPEKIGRGPHNMIDAETGQEMEIALDDAVGRSYRAAFAQWTENLKLRFARRQARYLMIGSDANPAEVFTRDLRRAGVIS